MKVPPFIIELLQRFATRNPNFFKVIQTISFAVGVVALIQENINGQSTTGKLLLQSILAPLYNNARLVADKPKETIKK